MNTNSTIPAHTTSISVVVSTPLYLHMYVCLRMLGVLILYMASYQVVVGSLDPEENHHQACRQQLPEEQNDPEHDVGLPADFMHVRLQHANKRINTQRLTNVQVAAVFNTEEPTSFTHTVSSFKQHFALASRWCWCTSDVQAAPGGSGGDGLRVYKLSILVCATSFA